MLFTKKTLALAVTCAMPGAAFAAIDLQNPNQFNIPTYASEISATSNITLGTVANDMYVDTLLGAGITNSTVYLRFDYPGTKSVDPVTIANLTVTGCTAAPTLNIATGGGTNDNFVVFSVSSLNPNSCPPTANVEFIRPTDTTSIVADAKTTHSISYRFYSTLVDAQTNNTANASFNASGTWYQFAKALSADCGLIGGLLGSSISQIDITDPTKFVSPLGSIIPGLLDESHGIVAGANVSVNSNLLAQDGTTFGTAPTDLFDVGSKVAVTSSAGLAFASSLDGIIAFNPTTIAGNTATYTAAAGGVLPGATGDIFLLTNNGQPMVPGDYSVVVTPVAAAGYTVAPINLGICGSLEYNGSSDRIDLGLTPVSAGGKNPQWLRVTNPSPTGGLVKMAVWNDAGQRVDVPFSAIKVLAANGSQVALADTLGAQSSTPLFTIDNVYAAAQSVDATFNVGTGLDGKPGKLRIEVRGAFGKNEKSGSLLGIGGSDTTGRLKTGIYIQAVSSATVFQSH